jgi:hypothetical protein
MTVDLPAASARRLEGLAERTYLGSKAAVIRHALAVFEHLLTLTENGGEIVVRMPSGEEKEIPRPMLAAAG